jgi:putative transposase
MHKAFQFRLNPTTKQRTLIHKSIGCSRFVYNCFLSKWNDTYKEMGKGLTFSQCSSLLTTKKKELEWLKEVDSTSLQNTLKHVADASSRFFQKMMFPVLKAGEIKFNPIPVSVTIPRMEMLQLK